MTNPHKPRTAEQTLKILKDFGAHVDMMNRKVTLSIENLNKLVSAAQEQAAAEMRERAARVPDATYDTDSGDSTRDVVESIEAAIRALPTQASQEETNGK